MRLPQIFVRFGVTRQRRRQRLGRILIPHAVRRRGTGRGDLCAELPHFLKLRHAQTLDLLLQRANAGHLADVRGHAPEQQIARHVERPRRDVPRISLGLHRLRPRQFPGQIFVHLRVYLSVCIEQRPARGVVAIRIRTRQLRRRDEPGFRKILVARRLCLPVPQRFVFDLARRQLADAFETQHGMPEIGNRLMPVLEVKAFQKTLRIVRPHPLDRLPDRIGRPAVARQRVGAFFRRHGGDGDDAFSQTAIIAVCAYESKSSVTTR